MATPFTIYKLIILYMLQHAEGPLTSSQISEFILDREYTNYFQLQQAISELVEAEFIEKNKTSNRSYYYITEEGTTTLSFFENELSEEIKNEVKEYLKNNGYEEEEDILTPTDYYETPQGRCAARCQIIEKNVALVDLNVVVPSMEAAKTICKNWPKKSQEIYGLIMEELL